MPLKRWGLSGAFVDNRRCLQLGAVWPYFRLPSWRGVLDVLWDGSVSKMGHDIQQANSYQQPLGFRTSICVNSVQHPAPQKPPCFKAAFPDFTWRGWDTPGCWVGPVTMVCWAEESPGNAEIAALEAWPLMANGCRGLDIGSRVGPSWLPCRL